MTLLASTPLPAASQPSRTLWLLHGILGAGRNWRSFARKLQAQYEGLQVVLVDLRGHGDSHGQSPPHTIEACVQDLLRLAREIGVPDVIAGHSFGGKVALMTAAQRPVGLAQVWSLDSPPGIGPSVPGEIDRVIDSVRNIPLPVHDRQDVVALLLEQGLSRSIAGWMTTNLVRGDGGLVWRFELPVIEALLADYFRTDAWPVIEDATLPIGRGVLYATRSERFSLQDKARLDRAAASLVNVHAHALPDAGHWVHVDNPDGLCDWMIDQLANN